MLEIVNEFVIEIHMKQARLFQCTPFHYVDCLMIL